MYDALEAEATFHLPPAGLLALTPEQQAERVGFVRARRELQVQQMTLAIVRALKGQKRAG